MKAMAAYLPVGILMWRTLQLWEEVDEQCEHEPF
jgi:hypothetical protein